MNRYDFDPDVQFDPVQLDRMYQGCFGYKTDGTFVEVGAYDGKKYSHTWGLAQIGWRGVCVEPVPSLAAKCMANHKDHPKITVLQCAAGATNGECTVHVDENCCCGSTLNPSICKEDKPFTAHVRTLDHILDLERIEPHFDLLSIDVEFAEVEVLKGFNARLWAPKMIIIELCETHGGPKQEWAAPARAATAEMLLPLGYVKTYADRINSIFVNPLFLK